MTIRRIATLCAEHGFTQDLVSLMDSGATAPANQPRTGNRSYQWNSLNYAAGPYCGHVKGVRVGYWLRWLFNDSFVPLFTAQYAPTYRTTARWGLYLEMDNCELLLSRMNHHTNRTILDRIPAPHSMQAGAYWTHLGFTYVPHETDGYFSMYVNGIRVLNYTGDTRMAGVPDGEQVYSDEIGYVALIGTEYLIANGFIGVNMDDLYVDEYVDEPDKPVPAKRFVMVTPSANGSVSEWSPTGVATNQQAVSTNPNNADTNYNHSNTLNAIDMYQGSSFSLPDSHRITGVHPFALARRGGIQGTPTLRIRMSDGVTTLESDDQYLGADYDRTLILHCPKAPDGGDWTETKVNSVQFGYKLTGTTA